MAKGKELLAKFKPGDNLPVYAKTTSIIAGRFVTISGRRAADGAFEGTLTGAGLAASGVAETDAIADTADWRGGTNLTRRGSIARVEAGAAITTGVIVASDATGRAIAHVPPNTTTVGQPVAATPVRLGICLGKDDGTGAITAAGQIANIDLF